MFKKYFYLVRHGETILNKEKKRQGPLGALSPEGRDQAAETGERIAKIKIDKVFCSPFERTRETFKIINEKLNFNENLVDFTSLLAERKNPTNIIGKSYSDPVVKHFIDTMDKSFHDPDLRISDEENFADLRDRSLACQEYLTKNGEKRNLCVTHGIFLKMFLSTLIYGKDLEQSKYIQMNEENRADNAAITLVSYDTLKAALNKILNRDPYQNKDWNPWEILSYNDYARDGKERLKI